MLKQTYWLEIVEGPNTGVRLALEPGSYRVLGRASSGSDSTIQLTREGDRHLDFERQQIVNRVVFGGNAPAPRVRGTARRRAADVDLQDDGVSRTHAMVFLDEHGNASVVDLMSTNGTQVNDAHVEDCDLNPGDVIRVGGTVLRLVAG
ncbi:MAG: FHA domain-containing protein [Myxococcota bacterium]